MYGTFESAQSKTVADALVESGDHVVEAVEQDSVLEDGDPVYAAKAKVLNDAIQNIGMGRYQWNLFIVVGFGWASDNLWPIVTSLIFTPITNEFHPSLAPMLTLSQNIGLLLGAMFWGFGTDIFGRRLPFNLTLGIASVSGLMAAASPNFVSICSFAALWSFGVGGSLPVDSSVFLEFLPGSHQYLLTVLSIYWPIAQLITTLIAWPLLGTMTCQQGDNCTASTNIGWRYFVATVGSLAVAMFMIRFFCFRIFESPKYLMGKGRDEEAVRVVHEIAKRNGKTSDLTVGDLRACDNAGLQPRKQDNAATSVKRKLESFDFGHIRALFATPKMARSTSLIMVIWAFIGLGYPLYNAFLPYIQATRGADFGDGSTYTTYRNSVIIASLGIPGALLGGVMVEMEALGRKGTLSLSTILTGLFLYGSTTAMSSTSLLIWNCAFSFTTNICYAVLFAYTAEAFPTKHRGSGQALTATSNRIFGIMAPIIAMFADLKSAAPVYISMVLFLSAGLLVIVLPYESRGRASL